jgi:DNA-binding NarL/FixJ family response regulator
MNPNRDLNVLLVEDSPVIRGLITDILGDTAGVRLARSVETEDDAVAVVRDGNVDVVILDLQLRAGTGFGVLRALRKMDPRPDVVVFTNFALSTYRETALELGAAHFLDKSRDYDRLPDILATLVEARAF